MIKPTVHAEVRASSRRLLQWKWVFQTSSKMEKLKWDISVGWLFADGFVRVEAMSCVQIDQLILRLNQVFEGYDAGIVGQEDQAGLKGVELGGDSVIGHVAGPEAFEHHHRQVWRQGDAA